MFRRQLGYKLVRTPIDDGILTYGMQPPQYGQWARTSLIPASNLLFVSVQVGGRLYPVVWFSIPFFGSGSRRYPKMTGLMAKMMIKPWVLALSWGNTLSCWIFGWITTTSLEDVTVAGWSSYLKITLFSGEWIPILQPGGAEPPKRTISRGNGDWCHLTQDSPSHQNEGWSEATHLGT